MKKNNSILVIVAIFSLFVIMTSPVSAYEERGRYIYDEAERLDLDSELILNAYLLDSDLKTDYEIVIAFMPYKMTIEEMGQWFDEHKVGKEDMDNGLVIFIYPDNTIYGMSGKGNSRIGSIYLTSVAPEHLQGFDQDPTLAIINLLDSIGDRLIEVKTVESGPSIGEVIKDNIAFIAFLISTLVIGVTIFQQHDGFQWEDLKRSGIVFALAIGITLFLMAASAVSDTTVREYGVITSSESSSEPFTKQHPVTDSEGNIIRYDVTHHIRYINNIGVKSYNLYSYSYKFTSEDNKGAWSYKPGDYIRFNVNEKLNLISQAGRFNDKSGGLTNRKGTWINWQNVDPS